MVRQFADESISVGKCPATQELSRDGVQELAPPVLRTRMQADIARAKRDGKLALPFDLEGTNALDGNIEMIAFYYRLGMRRLQPHQCLRWRLPHKTC